MRRILLMIFICQVLLLSCTKDLLKPDGNQDDLVGNWIHPEYRDSLMILEKSETLNLNEYGIYFKTNGKLVERKIDGWCGTPPVVYKDYDGTWSKQDSLISIEVGFWGGIATYNWIIISVSGNKLTVLRE
jgi:hypothetical protein